MLTFILITQGNEDGLRRSLSSIEALGDFDREILQVVGDDIVRPDSRLPVAVFERINECLARVSGDFVQLMVAGEVLQKDTFLSQVSMLGDSAESSCLIRCSESLQRESNDGLLVGPVFMFNCFEKLTTPLGRPEQLLFRRTNQTPVLDKRLSTLAFTDLALQLSQQGSVILQSVSTTPAPEHNSDEWLILADKYASFLRCVGWSQQAMSERIVHNSDVARQVRNQSIVFRSQIIAKECELTELLNSRSWRFTKWMRVLTKIVKLNNTSQRLRIAEVDGSFGTYHKYLTEEIKKIHRSRSWRWTATFRSWRSQRRSLSKSSGLSP